MEAVSEPTPARASNAKAELDALAAEAWEALVERSPYTAASAGRVVQSYPRDDLAEAEAAAAAARERRERLDRIDLTGLDRTERLTAAFLGHWFDDEMREPDRWWIRFGIAPYSASALAMMPPLLFKPIDLTQPGEAQRYLKLANEFADAIEVLHEKVLAQAERGWRMPKPSLPNVRRTLQGIAAASAAAIRLADDRPAGEAVRTAVAAIVDERLQPAFARILEAIGDEYEAAAPEKVGLMHLPGGDAAYRDQIKANLGIDLDPKAIHETGLREVAWLAAEMARVRAQHFGHNGDEDAFHEKLQSDPRVKAPSAEALEATYRGHLDRMAPVFARLFRKGPQAKGLVERLAPELEAGMTFGYYRPPPEPGDDGTYFYSGNGIPDRLQMNAAALIFHELVPGHHVHINRQAENEALPDLRRRTFGFGAFNEGWAEYSAGLGEEEGLYGDPYDYYGWLSHQRFVSQRLVVDTGLNALGWTLEEAHAYMSANTLEKPEQVTSELLRYSSDLPAQALCYRLGFLKFRELREKARDRLGDRFDLADFHEAVLDQGGLPLPVLEESLEQWALERAAADA